MWFVVCSLRTLHVGGYVFNVDSTDIACAVIATITTPLRYESFPEGYVLVIRLALPIRLLDASRFLLLLFVCGLSNIWRGDQVRLCGGTEEVLHRSAQGPKYCSRNVRETRKHPKRCYGGAGRANRSQKRCEKPCNGEVRKIERYIYRLQSCCVAVMPGLHVDTVLLVGTMVRAIPLGQPTSHSDCHNGGSGKDFLPPK